ncbi:MAG: cofactor-independent phosphoglycerate mutase [Thermoguttaceae bacterium]|nr:cofactor-independent phosphoglycerate mutase [Thermoguttaceae bacterium]MBQ6621070.1 cofactor-independent phosphoglycerate mutase [Thermoguttaceae bacterium]
MKYAVIIPDGFADEPIESLGGKTPMQAAHTPNLDALAPMSIIGHSHNVPKHLPPGSDVATLALLGYDPDDVYTGRAPLEAAALGIDLGENDWALRCNLVTLADGLMKSFTAEHISTEEGTELLKSVQERIAPQWNQIAPDFPGTIEFFPGVSYRNIMVFRAADAKSAALFSKATKTFPPHDYTDQPFEQALPAGDGAAQLRELMKRVEALFADHPVNQKRAAAGKLPATNAWLWGQGKRPNIVPFAERFGGIRGGMISAVDLLRGIAKNLKWRQIDVPGITGYVDTDYAAKGQYAARALDDLDLVCVHVEATDESGHEGATEKKVKALEDIDALVIPPVLEKLRGFPEWRLLVTPDHPTPVRIKTHSHGEVPWLIAGSDIAGEGRTTYDEVSAADSPHYFERGWELMPKFLGR